MSNPYQAPAANLSPSRLNGPTYVPAFFALRGRLGRARFVAYLAGTMMLVALVIFVVGAFIDATVSHGLRLTPILRMLIGVSMLLACLLVSARRLNDMDRSGLLALLGLVPFINVGLALWLLFGRGDSAANNYGPPPCANSEGVRVACVTALVIGGAYAVNAGITAFGAYKAAQVGFTANRPASAAQAPQ